MCLRSLIFSPLFSSIFCFLYSSILFFTNCINIHRYSYNTRSHGRTPSMVPSFSWASNSHPASNLVWPCMFWALLFHMQTSENTLHSCCVEYIRSCDWTQLTCCLDHNKYKNQFHFLPLHSNCFPSKSQSNTALCGEESCTVRTTDLCELLLTVDKKGIPY